jgi:hypothetical protein
MGTRRGRRLAIRLAAFAVVGAVVTVAVAWTLTIRTAKVGPYLDIPGEQWIYPAARSWPPNSIAWMTAGAPGVTVVQARSDLIRHSIFLQREARIGLPWRALCSREDDVLDAETFGETRTPRAGLDLPDNLEVSKPIEPTLRGALPVVPILPGFALDTAFYAAIAFALWSAPGVIRRRLRRGRGGCPACGYDLRGSTSAVCPECGATPKGEGVADGRGTEEAPSASAHE